MWKWDVIAKFIAESKILSSWLLSTLWGECKYWISQIDKQWSTEQRISLLKLFRWTTYWIKIIG